MKQEYCFAVVFDLNLKDSNLRKRGSHPRVYIVSLMDHVVSFTGKVGRLQS